MRIRPQLLVLVLLFTVLAAVCPATADPASEKAGTEAAQKWLGLIDAKQYAQSWNEIAPIMKQSIDAQNWANAVGSVRTMVGAMESRAVKSTTFMTQVPGSPKGKYVVIIYDTKFAKRAATETVTVMLCPDKAWRVAGYYVR